MTADACLIRCPVRFHKGRDAAGTGCPSSYYGPATGRERPRLHAVACVAASWRGTRCMAWHVAAACAHLPAASSAAASALPSLPLPEAAALPLPVPWDAGVYSAGGSPTCLLARLKLPTHTCCS